MNASGKKKKFQFRGKQILLLGLVALVITAGYYRWTIEQENFSVSVPTTSDAVPEQTGNNEGTEQEESESIELSALRRDRDAARSQSVEDWKKISQSSEASADAKREAEKKVTMETENAEKERKIETMVKAKGFEDCFVYVDDSGGEIDGAKVAQIKDIVVTETKVPARNIKINAI